MEPALVAIYLNPGPQFDWLTNIAIDCFHTMPYPVTSNWCKAQHKHMWSGNNVCEFVSVFV